jgi:hypothetical protein
MLLQHQANNKKKKVKNLEEVVEKPPIETQTKKKKKKKKKKQSLEPELFEHADEVEQQQAEEEDQDAVEVLKETLHFKKKKKKRRKATGLLPMMEGASSSSTLPLMHAAEKGEDTDWGELEEEIAVAQPQAQQTVVVEAGGGVGGMVTELVVNASPPTLDTPAYWETELPQAVGPNGLKLYTQLVHACEGMRLLARSRDGRYIACCCCTAAAPPAAKSSAVCLEEQGAYYYHYHHTSEEAARSSNGKRRGACCSAHEDQPHARCRGHTKKRMQDSTPPTAEEPMMTRVLIFEQRAPSHQGPPLCKQENEEDAPPPAVEWSLLCERSFAVSEALVATITDPAQHTKLQAHVTTRHPPHCYHAEPPLLLLEEGTSSLLLADDSSSLDCFRQPSALLLPTNVIVAISIPPATLLLITAQDQVACMTLGPPLSAAEGSVVTLNGIEGQALAAFITRQRTERQHDIQQALLNVIAVPSASAAPFDFTLTSHTVVAPCQQVVLQRFPSLLSLSKNIGRPSFSADKGPRLGKSPSLTDEEELEVCHHPFFRTRLLFLTHPS